LHHAAATAWPPRDAFLRAADGSHRFGEFLGNDFAPLPVVGRDIKQERSMQKGLVAVIAGVAMLVPTQTFAQVLTVEPEQRTIIREYVVRQSVPEIEVDRDLTVGQAVPEEVELSVVPQQWGPSVRSYRYVYTNDRVYLVEPSSRRIIQVMD
jgi:hypothetical protein